MTVVGIAPSVAQAPPVPEVPTSTAAPTTPTHSTRHRAYRHRVFRPATTSAASRNVGPSSTIGGDRSNVGGGRAGVTDLPGAPGAGPAGGGSGQ